MLFELISREISLKMLEHQNIKQQQNKFWTNKRVLITGDNGFKGQWLLRVLNLFGAKVYGFADIAGFKTNLFNKNSHYLTNCHRGDIRDNNALKKAFLDIEPTIVFHLAAQPLVSVGYSAPKITFDTNILGTINILEVAKTCKSCKVIINVTTDKVYENREEQVSFREDDPLGGKDPYSCSKVCSELITRSYYKSVFETLKIGISTARAGNVIGGGDWATDRLIPDLIRSHHQGKKMLLRNLEATRPWQHVLESINGYIKLAQSMYYDPITYSNAWNFGPQESKQRCVGEVIQQVEKIIKKTINKKVLIKELYEETHYLALDSSKANKLLGWSPKWSFDKTILETVNWYQNYFENNDVENLTEKQIRLYFGSEI